MAFCGFCKSGLDLKKCVCGKVSYCDKECQAKDWTSHKSFCPPYSIKESPGKGSGVFATRKIKPGQLIMEEMPILSYPYGIDAATFKRTVFPKITPETKEKILNLHDPAENATALNSFSPNLVDRLIGLSTRTSKLLTIGGSNVDESLKIFRISEGNRFDDVLYYDISRLNHSCNPNAWVVGHPKGRSQVRALKIIEKNEEILMNYSFEFNVEILLSYSFEYEIYKTTNCYSREERRKTLLEGFAFICGCLECSLEGEALGENERNRGEIRMKEIEDEKLMKNPSYENLGKSLKLRQEIVELVKRLDLQEIIPEEIMKCAAVAQKIRDLGFSDGPDPNILMYEAKSQNKSVGLMLFMGPF